MKALKIMAALLLAAVLATAAVGDEDDDERAASGGSDELADKMIKPIMGIMNLTGDIMTDFATGTEDNSTDVGRKLGQLRVVMALPTGGEDGGEDEDSESGGYGRPPALGRYGVEGEKLPGLPRMTEGVDFGVLPDRGDKNRMLLEIKEKKSIPAVIEQAKRLQILETKEELKERGETAAGSNASAAMADFVTVFNDYTNQLKRDTKNSVKSGSDPELTANVILAVANRELSRLREQEFQQREISETQASQKLGEFSNLEKEDKEEFENSLESINPVFKKKMALIALDGSLEEKNSVRSQIQDYVKQKNEGSPKLANGVKNGLIDPDKVRQLLEMQFTSQMIFDSLEEDLELAEENAE